MATFGTNYARRATAAAAPAYWAPGAISNPPVNYPTPSGAAVPTTRKPMSIAAYMNSIRQREAAYAPRAATKGSFAGVKTGSWGGNIMGGTVKSGDFGNPSPNTSDIKWNTHTIGGGGSGVNNMAFGGGTSAGGGGAGAGGAGGGYSNDLSGQFQRRFDEANQANEARYQDVLKGYQSRYERALQMLAGLGQQEGKDINELYDQQGAKINQNLIGRGLGNSTVTSTMAMGNERERLASLGRLNEQMRQQAMAADAGLSGDTLQFMERKTEAAPSMELLAQLAQGVGAAGGYGGGMPPAGMYSGGASSGSGFGGGMMWPQMMPFGFGGMGFAPRGMSQRQQFQAAQRAGMIPTGLTPNQRYGYSGTGPVGFNTRMASIPTGGDTVPWRDAAPFTGWNNFPNGNEPGMF